MSKPQITTEMTPAEHYAEAIRITANAVEYWNNPEGGYEPTTDPAELEIRADLYEDTRAEVQTYLALAQVHATLALYRPTPADKPASVKVANYQPVATGTCGTCGQPIAYNLAVGYQAHTDPAADTTCPNPTIR